MSGQFIVADSEITRRFAVSFAGPDLRLAKLTGASLKVLGGNADLSGTPDYRIPRMWARAIAAHPDNVDGFMYMSRHINDEIAVVLFERDATKPLALTMTAAVPLHTHVDFLRTVADLKLASSPHLSLMAAA